jgi:hypothetical protein
MSGIFGGLAFLTKSPSYYLLPYVGLVALIQTAADGQWLASRQLNGRLISMSLWWIAVRIAAWLAIAGITFFALWPAMWVDPGHRLSQVFSAALQHAKQPHSNALFFAGNIIKEDPGILFYIANVAWQTTAITLLGALLALYFLIKKRNSGEDARLWWYLLLYAGGFVLMMTLGAKKFGRYILPAIIAIDILAAWAIVKVTELLGPKVRLPFVKRGSVFLTAVVFIFQAILVLRHQPHFGTHFNSLLGGSKVAQHIFPLGLQGEGMDMAADMLNAFPGADRLKVSQYEGPWLMFTARLAGEISANNPEFTLFYVNYLQRSQPVDRFAEVWESYQQDDLAQTITYDGVPYVWICPTYPRDPDDYDMDQRIGVGLGQYIVLHGYDLDPAVLSPDESLQVKLYWQSNGQVRADNHVFIHLVNEAGELVAQTDGVPVNGEKPTWSWLEDGLVVDVHNLIIPSDLEAGLYTVSTGMYDIGTLTRLPATAPGGELLPDGRIELGDVQIIAP